MRESIGATFLIKIMVVFIVLYNALLAIAVNYAIAFRVKNQIINIVEQSEGCKNTGTKVRDYVTSVGYYRAASPTDKGYTITATQIPNRGTYYTINTFIQFDVPWVGTIVRPTITGQSKVIYGIYENSTNCLNI